VIRTVGGLREMCIPQRTHTPKAGFSSPAHPTACSYDRWLQFSEFADLWRKSRAGGPPFFPPAMPRGPLLGSGGRCDQGAGQHHDRAGCWLRLSSCRRDIRYFGNGDWSLYSPACIARDVIKKKRFGDCKEQVALLTTLLDRIDIRATPILYPPPCVVRRRNCCQARWLLITHIVPRVTSMPRGYYLDATRTEPDGHAGQSRDGGLWTGAAVDVPRVLHSRRLPHCLWHRTSDGDRHVLF